MVAGQNRCRRCVRSFCTSREGLHVSYNTGIVVCNLPLRSSLFVLYASGPTPVISGAAAMMGWLMTPLSSLLPFFLILLPLLFPSFRSFTRWSFLLFGLDGSLPRLDCDHLAKTITKTLLWPPQVHCVQFERLQPDISFPLVTSYLPLPVILPPPP